MENNIIEGVLYQVGEQLTPTITRGRVRLFYLGENRNKGIFTLDFANKLIQTIPYTPVKGDFNETKEDFEGHNRERNYEKVYGVVPEKYNFSWEKFIEDDGVEREYACVDVFLFTQLYEETSLILGKKQSLELYQPSIKGKWVQVEGKTLFMYEDAHFLGLQVLGDDKDPCYEGSAFFTLLMATKLAEEKLSSFSKNDSGGKKKMFNFPIEQSDNYMGFFSALNGDFDKEKGGTIKAFPVTIGDTSVDYFDLETGAFTRKSYTNQEGAIALSDDSTLVPLFFTKEDHERLKGILGEEMNVFTFIDSLNAAAAQKQAELDAANTSIAEMTAAAVEKDTKISTFEAEIVTLKAQNDALSSFQKEKETEEKKAALTKFESQISKESYDKLVTEMDTFSIVDFKKELAYISMEQTGIFSLSNPRIPGDDREDDNSLTALLSKYEKRVEE